jgi:Ohr subfamily peroxiredoxin
MKILYTAEATVSGGREGQARSSDGHLDVKLAVPKEMGGAGGAGTNPEQLFAAGYAACFESALMGVARRQHLDVHDVTILSRVGIGPTEGGAYGLSVEMRIHLPGLARDVAEGLIAAAHTVCPYSNATRGNIPVELILEEAPAAS